MQYRFELIDLTVCMLRFRYTSVAELSLPSSRGIGQPKATTVLSASVIDVTCEVVDDEPMNVLLSTDVFLKERHSFLGQLELYRWTVFIFSRMSSCGCLMDLKRSTAMPTRVVRPNNSNPRV